MNVLTAIGLFIFGLCLCYLAFRVIVNPAKLRNFLFRQISRRKDPIAEARREFMQAKWFLLNLRICAVAMFLIGLWCVWLGVMKIKA